MTRNSNPPEQGTTTPSTIPSSLLATTTREKLDLATAVLRLREEQLNARVVYFAPEQQTNAELDKITESVVAELRAIQSARREPAVAPAQADVEIELIGLLRKSLEKLFDPRRGNFLRAKLEVLSRKITTLFFEAELGTGASAEDLAGRELSATDQAVYFALAANREHLVRTLESMRYARPELKEQSIERMQRAIKNAQIEFLSHRAPELERLLEVFLDVFTEFFRETFRQGLGEFSWEVVRESGVTRPAMGVPQGQARVHVKTFAKFREVFDRKFLDTLVLTAQERIVARIRETPGKFSPEALRFVSDPRVYLAVCSIMCDAFYVHLAAEGILDLPAQWRGDADVA